MNITELRYVVETASAGSVSVAARRLFAAQPNISRAIKNLEHEYGITIFERSPSGVVPTPEGQHFIAQAKRIIEEVSRLDYALPDRDAQKVEFKAAIPRASYASSAFVNFVRELGDAERINIHIKECSSMEALNHIIGDGYHMALLRCRTENEGYYRSILKLRKLECEDIMEFQYRLLVNQDSPLAKMEIKNREMLEGYIELLHGDLRLPNGDYMEEVTDTSVNTDKKIYLYERGSQFSLLQGLKNTYMWVSPMPEHVMEQYGLVQKECPWQELKMKDILIYADGKLLRQVDRMFRDELRAAAKLVLL